MSFWPLPSQRERYEMHAAALSTVLRVVSISRLSTLSICSGHTTEQVRSESVRALGGAGTDAG
eukprot:6199551-Pleurochrysis_carterae.AAC.2